MGRRRSRKGGSRWWTWLSFLLFLMVIILLGGSLIKKQTPAQFLASVFKKQRDGGHYAGLSKSQLKNLLVLRDSTIASLQEEVDAARKRFGLGLATVLVDSETLNMRSEPSTTGAVIGRIPNGSVVIVLDYDDATSKVGGETGRWTLVEFGGDRGWVWGNYLQERE